MTTPLLPAGVRDLLPQETLQEAQLIQRFLNYVEGFSYRRVKPPLIENETTLLPPDKSTEGLRRQTFRFIDPLSREMLGLRADMTMQLARIAYTRLQDAPRPLRLCYAGEVVHADQIGFSDGRVISQAGCELFGAPEPEGEAEIIFLTYHALAAMGLEEVSIDLHCPHILEILLPAGVFDDPAKAATLRRLIQRKDRSGLQEITQDLPEASKTILDALMHHCGTADSVLPALKTLALPPLLKEIITPLFWLVERLQTLEPNLPLTIDLLESRGYTYDTGIRFSAFAAHAEGELARGGRYPVPGQDSSAVGVTVELQRVQAALTERTALPLTCYAPLDTPLSDYPAIQTQGYAVLRGLEPTGEPEKEAKRLGCAGWWDGGALRLIS